jgi:hypothetical protein
MKTSNKYTQHFCNEKFRRPAALSFVAILSCYPFDLLLSTD